MILRAEFSVQFVIGLVILSSCIPANGFIVDWVTKLEERRSRVQNDIDLMIKFFCSHDQSDSNCRNRLPQLREELRQIDEQLVAYRRGERRSHPRDIYRRPQQDQGYIDHQSALEQRRHEQDPYQQAHNNDHDQGLIDHQSAEDSRPPYYQHPPQQYDPRSVDHQGRSYTHPQPQDDHQPDRLIDLIHRGSYVLAEQDLLNREGGIYPIVQTVYDNRVENFKVVADFASAVRDGKLKFLLYKNLLEEIFALKQDDPVNVARLCRGVQDEVLIKSSLDNKTLTDATNMVENLKMLLEIAVVKLWTDITIRHSFEQDINVAALADEISTLDSNLYTRIISKVITALYPHVDTEHLMRNMEKFHLVPQLIDAYNAIYNEMANHNDINGKRYILKLGYYFKELIQRSNSTRLQLSPEKRIQLKMLEQRLPTSIRSLVFAERVCLKNKYVHDYLHIAHGHPRLTRYAVMAPGLQLKWKPKHSDYSVFFEFPYGGYLFADDRYITGRNRLVSASLKSDDMANGSEWKIEPHGDDCLIRNTAYDELLYVGDEFDEDHRSHKVFTTTGDSALMASDDRFKWTIQEC